MVVEKSYEYAKKAQDLCKKNDHIEPNLYDEYGVNLGLRDLNGNGVLTGLTNISKIISSEIVDGKKVPADGKLWYRGYRVEQLIESLGPEHLGFEKIAYLLLFGELPTDKQLKESQTVLAKNRRLPTNFVMDVIMKAPSKDIMNSLTKSVLTLASYDDKVTDNSLENVLSQSIMLISVFPMLAVYGYHAYNHYECDESFYIHRPSDELSVAENILRMLRPNKEYTDVEAKVLDLALVLHMEHGGGNNSTFTTRVVTSSGSDTYSAIAAALSSLKGKKHGGANIMVMKMIDDIKENITDPHDEESISYYLDRILNKEAFDKKGLIYGMGHAVYSLSDPREVIFKDFVERLAVAKGRDDDMALYNNIEKIAPKLIGKERKIFKGVSPNVDFYSGFVYDMLVIPVEFYTPLFAIARIVGWSEHRIEELISANKIIRPAYKSLVTKQEYQPRKDRK